MISPIDDALCQSHPSPAPHDDLDAPRYDMTPSWRNTSILDYERARRNVWLSSRRLSRSAATRW